MWVQIPDGFDVIELPECKYLMCKGEHFEEENFEDAIRKIWPAVEKYDPSVVGFDNTPHNANFSPKTSRKLSENRLIFPIEILSPFVL